MEGDSNNNNKKRNIEDIDKEKEINIDDCQDIKSKDFILTGTEAILIFNLQQRSVLFKLQNSSIITRLR